jgi:nucleotide-binding universal stress UspA family protein
LKLQTIVAAVDFSDPSEAAFARALVWAREFSAQLCVLHCYEIPRPGVGEYQVAIPDTLWERVQQGAMDAVEAFAERARAEGIEATGEVCEGPPAEGIRLTAERLGADLVVLGTHGHRGVERILLGSVAERTVRTAPCAVLTARSSGPEASSRATPERIVVASDFSEHSAHAVTAATGLAARFGARLHLVHAFGLPVVTASPYDVVLTGAILDEAREQARRSLEEAARGPSAAGVEVEIHLAHTPAPEAITELARDLAADLIVMGTHGHTGLKHTLLGSVAERTLRTSPCSVLTVKAAQG